MFKINDRVKVKIAEGVEQCGKIIGKDENIAFANFVLFQNGNYGSFPDGKLTLITDPMDCLMVGDILERVDGQRRKILGICGEIYFVSRLDMFERAGTSYTLRELKSFGYTFSQPNSTKIQEALDLLEREGKIVNGKIIKENYGRY